MKMNWVAPHAGAWIETMHSIFYLFMTEVAPHAGAWIETPSSATIQGYSEVAPHAGAWIETLVAFNHPMSPGSRSPCGSVD